MSPPAHLTCIPRHVSNEAVRLAMRDGFADLSTAAAGGCALLYRYTFNNSVHYLVFPATLEFVSPQRAFTLSGDEMAAIGSNGRSSR